MKNICICGGGDIAISFICKLSKSDKINLFWYSRTKILPEKITVNYLGKVKETSNYNIVNDKSVHKYQYDVMIFTYPHIYYQLNMDFLKQNRNITKCIYFMYCMGSCLDIINSFKREYPHISYIMGEKALFHAKKKNSIVHVTKECNSKCYCSDTTAKSIVSFLKNNKFFDLQLVTNKLDIIFNTSNMIIHPSIWYDHYIQNNNSFEKDKYVYRGIHFNMVHMYSLLYLELLYIKYRLNILNPIKFILPVIILLILLIYAVKKNIFTKKNITKKKPIILTIIVILLVAYLSRNIITSKIFEHRMPQMYFGDRKIKEKHYQRDILNGCYYITKYCEKRNIKLYYFPKICSIFMNNPYFSHIPVPKFKIC